MFKKDIRVHSIELERTTYISLKIHRKVTQIGFENIMTIIKKMGTAFFGYIKRSESERVAKSILNFL